MANGETNDVRQAGIPRAVSRRQTAGRLFAMDVRSLAVMRIGLGLVLLLSLYERAADVSAHYSDEGILSREARKTLNPHEEFVASPWYVSLHMLSGEPAFQYALLAAAAVFAAMVLVGCRTPWAMFSSWILLIGVQARNPLVLQGGDDVLRCMMFFCLFVPLGAAWSMDGRLAKPHGAPRHGIASIATAALVVQLACIYFFTGLLKQHPLWWRDLDAVYYALHVDHFTTPFGQWLCDFPLLLKGMTIGSMVLELVGPVLLICCWRNERLRTMLFFAFVGFHLGIAATMELGLFPLICIAFWSMILPRRFWTVLRWKTRRWRRPALKRHKKSVSTANAVEIVKLSWATNALLALLLAYVLLLNVVRIRGYVFAQLGFAPLRVLGEAAQLNQYWCMFAPKPHLFGGWLHAPAVLADGTEVDLLRPKESNDIKYSRPTDVAAEYKNQRWRKCMMNLFERECPGHRSRVGEYLIRKWNAEHAADEQIVRVELIHVMEPTPPPDKLDGDPPPKEREVLYRFESTTLSKASGG